MGEAHGTSPATVGNSNKAKKASQHRNKGKAKKKTGVGQVQLNALYCCYIVM